MMTPHTSQTPRYGQMTPTQQGQFLRPGAPVSRTNPTYRASPFTSGASPRVMMPPVQTTPNRRYSSAQDDDDWDKPSRPAQPAAQAQSRRYAAAQDDDDDWDKAAEAWGTSRTKVSTPRGDSVGRSTPRG